MRKILTIVGLSILVSCGYCLNAKAFSLKPIKFFFTVDPGKEYVVPIEIKNNEASPVAVQPIILGMRLDKNDLPVFAEGTEEAENWVENKPEITSLSPGEEKKIIFTIRIPTERAASTHYLGLGVQSVGSASASSTVLSARLLSLITLQVAGDVRESLKIVNWASEQPISLKKEWRFLLDMKNEGNIDALVSGEIVIKNTWGKIISQNPIRPTTVLSRAEKQLQIIGQKISSRWPGRYETTIHLTYGLTKQSISKSFYVLYIPAWFFSTFIVITASIIGGIIFFKIKNRYE